MRGALCSVPSTQSFHPPSQRLEVSVIPGSRTALSGAGTHGSTGLWVRVPLQGTGLPPGASQLRPGMGSRANRLLPSTLCCWPGVRGSKTERAKVFCIHPANVPTPSLPWWGLAFAQETCHTCASVPSAPQPGVMSSPPGLLRRLAVRPEGARLSRLTQGGRWN